MTAPPRRSTTRGFAQAGGILEKHMEKAGAKRGFAQLRLITAWSEVVGPALARVTRPVRVGYAKAALGATLTVEAPGARAHEVQMQSPQIISRVNALYGYRAVARLRITHSAEEVRDMGFAENSVPFAPEKPERAPDRRPDPAALAELNLENVTDPALREALYRFSCAILSGHKTRRFTDCNARN